jgi:hypothetical protein
MKFWEVLEWLRNEELNKGSTIELVQKFWLKLMKIFWVLKSDVRLRQYETGLRISFEERVTRQGRSGRREEN